MNKQRLNQIRQEVQAISALHIGTHAAHSCFFIILSVFPALLLVVSILRYTMLQVEDLMQLMADLLPAAFMPWARRLVENTYDNSSGAMVSVSALTALWSASRGLRALQAGLNSVYCCGEKRNFLRIRFISVLYTLMFLVVLVLTLVLQVFGNALQELLEPLEGAVFRAIMDVVDFRFFLLLAVQTALFTAMYMAMPNQHNRFWDSVPGALTASIGWLIFTDVFSLYVEYFEHYSNIYGSVYAVALCMLWLYCCICIIFFGGALNSRLIQHKNVSNS